AGAAFVASALVVMGLFFLLGSVDQRAFALRQLQTDKGQFQCLGVVPDTGPTSDDPEALDIAMSCVHRLRNRIESIRGGKRERGFVMLISSPFQGDGKTTIATLLGWSYAEAGYRTCLVDCDFIGRSLSHQFGKLQDAGLKEVLKDGDLASKVIPLGNPNLNILPIGLDPSINAEHMPLSSIQTLLDELRSEFDLIILCYQVWYLSPALPMTAFLHSDAGKSLIRNKPVVTLVACRNMWLSAQETMRQLIAEAGGKLCDHIAFTDRGHPLATFITTPRWVLTGKRDRFLGMPPAGVAPEEIKEARRFGRALADALDSNAERSGQPMLRGLRAVTVNPRLAISERAGRRAFGVWSRLIRAFGQRGSWQRRPALLVFSLYLIVMVLTVVPTSLLLQWLLSPLLKSRLEGLRAQLEQPSGSEEFNLKKYDQSR
ncbi:MAG: hypothetical protein MK097_14005, partial [Dechloromonas sp.]|nr:hypothetical protein [Dechloromonas sp.]